VQGPQPLSSLLRCRQHRAADSHPVVLSRQHAGAPVALRPAASASLAALPACRQQLNTSVPPLQADAMPRSDTQNVCLNNQIRSRMSYLITTGLTGVHDNCRAAIVIEQGTSATISNFEFSNNVGVRFPTLAVSRSKYAPHPVAADALKYRAYIQTCTSPASSSTCTKHLVFVTNLWTCVALR
jgi:hypothetical protein